jgi:hypothetical protein
VPALERLTAPPLEIEVANERSEIGPVRSVTRARSYRRAGDRNVI